MMMGWKPGEGVGKDGRGIATPVEAVLRKGKGAIGKFSKVFCFTAGGKNTIITIIS